MKRLSDEGAPAGWTRVRGRVASVWTKDGEVAVLGAPVAADEAHNCDANGCGQDHVLIRSRASRLSPEDIEALKTARMVLEADFEATKARYPKGTPMNPHIPQALAVLDRLVKGGAE